jgi:cell division protease FtsH
MEELQEAIERVISGPERKSSRLTEKEKTIVAYHEAGHAIVQKALPNSNPIHKITIVSRGQALGYVMSFPDEDKRLHRKSELTDRIAGLMGGRVAEELTFGDITSGAANDIKQATQLARTMVTQLGMSDKLGTVAMGHKEELVFLGRDLGEQRNYSEEVAALIDEEIRLLISNGYETARHILTAQKDRLELLAEHLKVVESLDAAALDALLAQAPIAASSVPASAS